MSESFCEPLKETLESVSPEDLRKTAVRPRGLSKRRLIVSVALGIVLGVGFIAADIDLTPTRLAILAITYILSIALHETGHLIGARLMGFKALAMGVGWLTAFRERDSWRVRVSRRFVHEGW